MSVFLLAIQFKSLFSLDHIHSLPLLLALFVPFSCPVLAIHFDQPPFSLYCLIIVRLAALTAVRQ